VDLHLQDAHQLVHSWMSPGAAPNSPRQMRLARSAAGRQPGGHGSDKSGARSTDLGGDLGGGRVRSRQPLRQVQPKSIVANVLLRLCRQCRWHQDAVRRSTFRACVKHVLLQFIVGRPAGFSRPGSETLQRTLCSLDSSCSSSPSGALRSTENTSACTCTSMRKIHEGAVLPCGRPDEAETLSAPSPWIYAAVAN